MYEVNLIFTCTFNVIEHIVILCWWQVYPNFEYQRASTTPRVYLNLSTK